MSPFRYPVFRTIWIASVVSNFGGLIQSVGAAWLMTAIGGTPAIVALVQTANTLPIMLFSLPAGAIADNFDKRKLMIASQTFLMVVSIGLAGFTYFDMVTPLMLLAFTFLLGCGNAFNGPAWQSAVGDMVERPDIPSAVAMNAVGFNIARSVGPAIGGFIVASAGAFTAFAINCFSYIGLLTALARWKLAPPSRALPPESLASAMGAGLRYVAMSPRIGVVLLRGSIFGLCGISMQALMPVIARDLVNGGPLTYGVLLCGFGAGAVCGAFLTTRLRQSLSVEWIIRIAFLGTATATILAGFSRAAPLSFLAAAIGGGSWVMALSSFNAAVQLSAPRWVVGRAMALYQVATFGGMALGAWGWGYFADHVGTGTSLVVSGASVLVATALGFWFPLPETKGLNLDLRQWNEPDVAIDIRQRSGPIVVTIEFVIDETDIPEFLAVMAERRRIRRRDGARHWTLLRDLADPKIWVERYHAPTWLEYIRHNQRMTLGDIGVGEQLRALHRGDTPPKVRRMIERQATWRGLQDAYDHDHHHHHDHHHPIIPPMTHPGGPAG